MGHFLGVFRAYWWIFLICGVTTILIEMCSP